MEDEQPPEGDALFGSNVRMLREEHGMSQKALAEVMRRHGRPWHQSTTGRVESGQQPAQVGDVDALMRIFGVDYSRFRWRPAEAVAAANLRMEAVRVQGCAREVAAATRELLSAIFLAKKARDASAAIDAPAVRDAIGALNSVLRDYDLKIAIGQGRRQYLETHDDEGSDDGGDTEGEPGLVDQQRA